MESQYAPKILFIEDDNAGRAMGVFNLSRAGYRVDGASDGERGIELFAKGHYDLVITDVKMPGMSGIDVLARVRDRSPQTPVVVITAFSDMGLAATAIRNGAYDFIGKPFSRDHLLGTIRRALANPRLGMEVGHNGLLVRFTSSHPPATTQR